MKTIQKPFNNKSSKATIKAIWEVLLSQDLWAKMEKAKEKNPKLTYSWISRYCLFRLLRHSHFDKSVKWKSLQTIEKKLPKSRELCHRHMMCLYGKDEDWIRLISIQFGSNVSKLIRLALLWYLDELLENEIPMMIEEAKSLYKQYGKTSFKKIKMFGTKVTKDWKLLRKDYQFLPKEFKFRLFLFEKKDFW